MYHSVCKTSSQLLLAFILFAFTLATRGQDAPARVDAGKRTASSILVGLGATNQYDSYLSPIEYKGLQFSVVAESRHRLRSLAAVSFQSLLQINLHNSITKAETSRYLGGDLHYDAGWHYNWDDTPVPNLTVFAGGQIGTTLGGLYTTRSGNNPANAHANIHLSASVGASYRFHIKRLPINARYQADMPLLGAAFSPNYGQSYFEMWQKGGYEHNIVLAYPGNAFSIRQMLTLSLQLGKCNSLSIGYLGDIRNATLNNLGQHQYSHSLLIGWAKNLSTR